MSQRLESAQNLRLAFAVLGLLQLLLCLPTIGAGLRLSELR